MKTSREITEPMAAFNTALYQDFGILGPVRLIKMWEVLHNEV